MQDEAKKTISKANKATYESKQNIQKIENWMKHIFNQRKQLETKKNKNETIVKYTKEQWKLNKHKYNENTHQTNYCI